MSLMNANNFVEALGLACGSDEHRHQLEVHGAAAPFARDATIGEGGVNFLNQFKGPNRNAEATEVLDCMEKIATRVKRFCANFPPC